MRLRPEIRYKLFAEALTYIVGHADVWLATTDDIAAHFASFAPDWSQAEAFHEDPGG